MRIFRRNVQGIGNKLYLLQVTARRDNIDIFLLHETLAPSTRPVNLRGYTNFSIPFTRGGSQGLTTLVKNSIPCQQIAQPPQCGEVVDVLATTILPQNTSLTIYNLYITPGVPIDLGFANTVLELTLVAGDFNSPPPLRLDKDNRWRESSCSLINGQP